MTSSDQKNDNLSPMNLLAIPVNWLIPGLGLWLIGEKKRAIIVILTVHLTMLIGLAIGGVSSVDRQQQFLYFFFQAPAGPSVFAVNAFHQNLREQTIAQTNMSSELGDPVPYFQAFGNELSVGALYVAIAGIMNVFVFIDLLARVLSPRGRALRHELLPEGKVETSEEGGS